MDKKEMDAFVTRMANGRKHAKATRVQSNAPPSPVVKRPRERKAAPNPPESPNRNTVVGTGAKLPSPAPSSEMHVHVHLHGKH